MKKEQIIISIIILALFIMIIVPTLYRVDKNYQGTSKQSSKHEEVENQNEKFSDTENHEIEIHNFLMLYYDNYALVSETDNKSPDGLLEGDIITGINGYELDGYSEDEIAGIFESVKNDCKREYSIRRDDEDLTIVSINPDCYAEKYSINFDFYDNYIYVTESGSPYDYDLLSGDMIISANDHNFDGLKANEIHEIWESLKSENEVVCKVKRNNEILTIIK